MAMTQNSAKQPVTLPEGAKFGSFRPTAYYDKYMDCIRVTTHDRSVTEHRLDGFLTLHECNHRGRFDPLYVGFTIKGIKHLFAQAGLSLDGVYKLAELIDKLVSLHPGSAMSEVLRLVYDDHKTTGDLEVDLRDAA